MNWILFLCLVVALLIRTKQGFMTRVDSFDVSEYASNTYPCVNGRKQEPHFQP